MKKVLILAKILLWDNKVSFMKYGHICSPFVLLVVVVILKKTFFSMPSFKHLLSRARGVESDFRYCKHHDWIKDGFRAYNLWQLKSRIAQ